MVKLRTWCSTDSHLPGLTMTSLKKVTANKASMTKKTKRSWRIHLTKQKQKIKPTNTFWILLRLEGCFEAIFDVWDMLFTQVPCKKKGTSKAILRESFAERLFFGAPPAFYLWSNPSQCQWLWYSHRAWPQSPRSPSGGISIQGEISIEWNPSTHHLYPLDWIMTRFQGLH